MLLAGWRYRSSGWVTSVLAGAGSQTVADAPRLFEVGVDSPLKDRQVLALRAGYMRTAAFGGPDYRYQYIQANWTVRF
jgi:hypothetical protein